MFWVLKDFISSPVRRFKILITPLSKRSLFGTAPHKTVISTFFNLTPPQLLITENHVPESSISSTDLVCKLYRPAIQPSVLLSSKTSQSQGIQIIEVNYKVKQKGSYNARKSLNCLFSISFSSQSVIQQICLTILSEASQMASVQHFKWCKHPPNRAAFFTASFACYSSAAQCIEVCHSADRQLTKIPCGQSGIECWGFHSSSRTGRFKAVLPLEGQSFALNCQQVEVCCLLVLLQLSIHAQRSQRNKVNDGVKVNKSPTTSSCRKLYDCLAGGGCGQPVEHLSVQLPKVLNKPCSVSYLL